MAKLNHTVKVNYQDWNIDLALGPPPGLAAPPSDGQIRFEAPVIVEVAIEAKAVMTEHGKARRNRLRDLQAFHDDAHTYNQQTVAVGTVVRERLAHLLVTAPQLRRHHASQEHRCTRGEDGGGLPRPSAETRPERWART